MNRPSSDPINTAAIAVSAIAAASMAMLAATALHRQDEGLVVLLGTLLSVHQAAGSGSGGSTEFSLVNFAIACLIGAAASIIGGLSAVPRLICWLQLFVLSLVGQWFLLSTPVQPRPIAFFSAIVFGGAFGYLLRLRKMHESKKQSQYMELTLRNRELQEARLQMVKQDEVDRRLLAADLHDQVLNDLKILNQKFQTYTSNPGAEAAADIDKLVHQAMNGVRDVMDSLSPAVLEHLGFTSALEDCLRRASERSGGFKVRFKNLASEVDFTELSLIEQTLLYRLVQECGTNICKHANATIVKVSVEIADRDLLIRVVDNGKGLPSGIDAGASRGLRYMRQRGDLIGATIAWLPGENEKGTCVEIRMPMRSESK